MSSLARHIGRQPYRVANNVMKLASNNNDDIVAVVMQQPEESCKSRNYEIERLCHLVTGPARTVMSLNCKPKVQNTYDIGRQRHQVANK